MNAKNAILERIQFIGIVTWCSGSCGIALFHETELTLVSIALLGAGILTWNVVGFSRWVISKREYRERLARVFSIVTNANQSVP